MIKNYNFPCRSDFIAFVVEGGYAPKNVANDYLRKSVYTYEDVIEAHRMSYRYDCDHTEYGEVIDDGVRWYLSGPPCESED